MSESFTPTPFQQGRLLQALEIRRLARARSPRARAGRVGGLMAALAYPAGARPRDALGRFTTRKE